MARTPLLLAIDQGTTSSRAIIFTVAGEIVAVSQKEFPQIYPQPGWVEHDPEAIWETTVKTARSAIAMAEESGGEVFGIGITNQRETTVVWDRKTAKPIYNAIVWQDRRTADLCQKLKQDGSEALVQQTTGLLLDPYFSATKLGWILSHVDGASDAAKRGELCFGTIDSFLLARLTGGAHLTDATNAARTSLFNIVSNKWDDRLLDLFGVPKTVLPEVSDNVGEFGRTAPAIFGRSLPIFAMVGDQQAAAIGQACLAPGDIKSTYGTGCFVLAPVEEFKLSRNRLLTTIGRRIDGQAHYALEGSIFVAGAVVQWLRDELKLVSNAAETEELARSLPDNGGVYLVPAFAGLGAPHWDAHARAAILGLTRGAGRAHLARAALESVAYQTADLIDAMRADGASCDTLKVDGGMVANDWLMQFLADIQDAPVDRPAILETTAFGAALLAGVGAGIFTSVEEVSSLRKTDATFEPAISEPSRQALRDEWRTALKRVLS
ncbi:MAG: glycerol kinase GlpK [Parvularculaceae bacterium]